MDAVARRAGIMEVLARARGAIRGQELAEQFGVSRQVVVYDVALLRAEGHDVLSTPRGYMLNQTSCRPRAVLACSHDDDGMRRELELIVDNGGTVLDVIVEHPLYGDLRGSLMLSCRSDVEAFLAALGDSGARPLSALTGGPHLHTVEAASPAHLQAVTRALGAAGILLEGS